MHHLSKSSPNFQIPTMTTDEKALIAVQRMLDQPGLITDVAEAEHEYYFKFKGHVFSVLRRTRDEEFGVYSFYIYPRWTGATDALAELYQYGEPENPATAFHCAKMSPDAEDLFAKLYQVIDSKVNGVDELLDDIINDSDLF